MPEDSIPDDISVQKPLIDRSVLVIIPTYQESANIGKVLPRIRSALPSASILVVDDNSPDGTAELAKKTGKDIGNVNVLVRPEKSGLGSAYRAGFAWGLERDYEILVGMDADLQHDPDDLPRLVNKVVQGADLAIGSRYVPGGAIPGWPVHRVLLSRYGNRYVQIVAGLSVKDATSGYRAFSAEILRKADLGTVRADGYGFQIEMAYRVSRLGGEVVELPITFVERIDGASKMSTRIIVEALILVTRWGVRDRIFRRKSR